MRIDGKDEFYLGELLADYVETGDSSILLYQYRKSASCSFR